MSPVVIYTKEHCGYCRRAKALFEERGVDFEEISVEEAPERRREMLEVTGRDTLPQVILAGRHIGGFEQLSAMDENGELDRLLGGAAR